MRARIATLRTSIAAATRGRLPRLATALLILVTIAALAAGLVIEIRHTAEENGRRLDAQRLTFAMDAAAALVSRNKQNPDEYLGRVLALSTGGWRDELEVRRRAVVDTMGAAAGSAVGRGLAAGIERRNDDGTVSVLVVVSAEPVGAPATPAPAGGPDAAARTQPEQYQLRLEITGVDGEFKLSKVGFA